MARLLDGVLVLDLTRMLAGPYGGLLLADLGAEVIKVEEPRGGDPVRAMGPPFVKGESAYFISINRNKKSLTLDLATPRGREGSGGNCVRKYEGTNVRADAKPPNRSSTVSGGTFVLSYSRTPSVGGAVREEYGSTA